MLMVGVAYCLARVAIFVSVMASRNNLLIHEC